MLSESKRSMAAGGIAGGAARYPCAGGGAGACLCANGIRPGPTACRPTRQTPSCRRGTATCGWAATAAFCASTCSRIPISAPRAPLRRRRSAASFRLLTARCWRAAPRKRDHALAQDGSITKFSYEQGLEDGRGAAHIAGEGRPQRLCQRGQPPVLLGGTGLSAGWTVSRIGPGSIFDLYERDGKPWLLQDSGIYALDKAQILAGETPHATQYGTARGLTGSPAGKHLQLYGPGRQPVSGHTKRRQRV